MRELEWIKKEVIEQRENAHFNYINMTDNLSKRYNQGAMEALENVLELFEQFKKPRLPVIPEFVANEIEHVQKIEEEKGDIKFINLDKLEDKLEEDIRSAQDWKAKNLTDYCTAYAVGYIIEEDTLKHWQEKTEPTKAEIKKRAIKMNHSDIKMEALIAWNEYEDITLKDKMRREVE